MGPVDPADKGDCFFQAVSHQLYGDPNCIVPSLVLGPHDEMVPVGVFIVDRRDHYKYSWAGLLGKMHSFPIPGEDWNLSTCLYSVFSPLDTKMNR